MRLYGVCADNGRILLANPLQSARSTFSWGSFLSFFAFQEGMLDTQILAPGGWPTVSLRFSPQLDCKRADRCCLYACYGNPHTKNGFLLGNLGGGAKIRDPSLPQPRRNAWKRNVLSAAFSWICRVPLLPVPATATKASESCARIVRPTNWMRGVHCGIFPPRLCPASKILNLIWTTNKRIRTSGRHQTHAMHEMSSHAPAGPSCANFPQKLGANQERITGYMLPMTYLYSSMAFDMSVVNRMVDYSPKGACRAQRPVRQPRVCRSVPGHASPLQALTGRGTRLCRSSEARAAACRSLRPDTRGAPVLRAKKKGHVVAPWQRP